MSKLNYTKSPADGVITHDKAGSITINDRSVQADSIIVTDKATLSNTLTTLLDDKTAGLKSYLGTIRKTSSEVEADKTLLTTFVQDLNKTVSNNMRVITSDYVVYEYFEDRTNWDAIGFFEIVSGTSPGEIQYENKKLKLVGYDQIISKFGDFSGLALPGSNGGKPASVKEIAEAIIAKIGEFTQTTPVEGDSIIKKIEKLKELIDAKPSGDNFYSKSETYNKSEVEGLVNNKIGTTELNNALRDYARTNDVNSSINQAKQEVTTSLEASIQSVEQTASGASTAAQEAKSAVTSLETKLNNKIATDISTAKSEIANERTQAISQATTNLDGKITQVDGKIDNLRNEINSLKTGSLVRIGEIQKTASEVRADKDRLLNEFVQTKKSRTPKDGDIVYTTDQFVFTYDGENSQWDDGYQNANMQATNDISGTIKLSDQPFHVGAGLDGTAKINGAESLATKDEVTQSVQGLRTSIDQNTQNISTQDGKIGVIERKIPTIENNINTANQKAQEAKTSVVEAENRINQKIQTDIATSEQKITGERTQAINTAINGVTQQITNVDNKVTSIQAEINSIKTGTMNRVGEIQKTATEVRTDKDNILNEFVNQKKSRAPRDGDIVWTTDHFVFSYFSNDSGASSWDDGVQNANMPATTQISGTIKLSNDPFHVGPGNDGTAKINNIDQLATVENLTNSINRVEQSIQQTNQQVQGVSDRVIPLETKIPNLEQAIHDADTKAQEAKTSIAQTETKLTQKITTDIAASEQKLTTATTAAIRDSKTETLREAQEAAQQAINTGVSSLNQPITELRNEINSIKTGMLVRIGQIAKTHEEVNADKDNLLNTFVQTKKSRAPRDGDIVWTTDKFIYSFISGAWDNGEQNVNLEATLDVSGTIKLSDQQFHVGQGDQPGTAKIVGADQLATKMELSGLTDKYNQQQQSIGDINTTLQSKADADQVYSKGDADGKFATTDSLSSLTQTVSSNTQSINTIQGSLSDKANVGDSYTKEESDNKFGLKSEVERIDRELGDKAPATTTVTTNTTQTISGTKTFSNGFFVGGFKFTPETNALRMAPNANGKWLYFGDGANNYFRGINLNSSVALRGIMDPTDNTDAINKRYLENTLNPVSQKVTTLEATIARLEAKRDFVQVATFTRQQAEENSFQLLNEFVQNNTTPNRQPQMGDEVVTSDNYRFIFATQTDGQTSWVVEASQAPAVATTNRLGLTMFGTDEGEVEDAGSGKMRVRGYTALKQVVDGHTTSLSSVQTTLTGKANDDEVIKKNTGSPQTIQDKLNIQEDGRAFSINYSTATVQSYLVLSQGGTTENFKLGKTTTADADFYFAGSSSSTRWIFSQVAQYSSSSISITNDAQFIHKKHLYDNFIKNSGNNQNLNSNVTLGYGKTIKFRDQIHVGYGGNVCRMTSEDGSTKTLQFYGTGNNNKLNLDLGGKAKLSGLKDPVNETDATNKRYVDNGLSGKANDNAVVKLTSNSEQTINSPVSIENSFTVGGFRLTSEANALRVTPPAASKWLYFGNPNVGSGGTYFAGIDFNNLVRLAGIMDPTDDRHAAPKKYVDERVASISTGNMVVLDPDTRPDPSSVPNGSVVFILERERT